MARPSDPPAGGYDKNGKPVWGPRQIEYCKGCKTHLHRSEFSGVKFVQYYCRKCHAAKRRSEKEFSLKPHKDGRGYTHLIKHKKTGHVYRYFTLDSTIPKGYTVLYKMEAGTLMPGFYKKYDVYEPEVQD